MLKSKNRALAVCTLSLACIFASAMLVAGDNDDQAVQRNDGVYARTLFQIGDGIDPAIPGVASVDSDAQPGPDWADLFSAGGTLLDEESRDGLDIQPGGNGVPDSVERFGGRGATFIADDISAGASVDSAILAGDRSHWLRGAVPAQHDLGNAYVYATSDAEGNLVLYAGLERLTSVGASHVEFEFNQDAFLLRENPGLDPATPREIVGERRPGDVLMRVSFDDDGRISALEVLEWALVDPTRRTESRASSAENAAEVDLTLAPGPSAETYAYVRLETVSGEGCNDGMTLCAFSNAEFIPSGPWTSFGPSGGTAEELAPLTFVEMGLNIGRLRGFDTDYATVQVTTPVDLALGDFDPTPPDMRAHGGGSECMDNQGCTSEDVRVAEYELLSCISGCSGGGAEPLTCVEGTDITLNLTARTVAGAAERYDVGFYVALDGGDAKKLAEGGTSTSCYNDYLHETASVAGTCTNAGATFDDSCEDNQTCDTSSGAGDGSCSSLALDGGPFYNAEVSEDPCLDLDTNGICDTTGGVSDAGDACGDIRQGEDAFFTLETITIKCQDKDSDDTADVDTCTAWDIQASNENAESGPTNKPSCKSEADTQPPSNAKCKCGPVTIVGLTVVTCDDTDGDGVCDDDDNCPTVANTGQDDADTDGLGDACDICPQDADNDSDGDTICNTGPTGPGATGTNDNCPDDANTNQADGDGDGVGDVCDPCPLDNPDDTDGDGVCDSDDACPGFDDSADADSDGLADGCDICPQDTDNDSDGDTICNTGPTGPGATGTNDNCPDDANTNQADGDGDGVGDVCDPCPLDNPDDTDGDGVCDSDDACPGFDDSADADSDGLADGCDICPQDTDNDSDGDTICNTGPTGPGATGTNDNCPDDANTNQADGDGDGVGDVCDPCPLDNPDDTDGDGVCDSDDACPGFDDSADADSDGLADGCDICPQDTDNDSDGDTICNTGPTGPGATGTNDNCPDDANTNQADGDGDGVGDVCDPCPEDNPDDTDGDGVCDSDDACPGFDDSADADSDGLADGCDICPQDTDNDSDGDTICNTGPTGPGATGTNDNCPDDANTNQADGDGDGVGDVCDPCPEDNPDDTDGDGVCDSDDACPGFDDSADADSDGLADGCDICPQDTDNDSDGDTICNTGPTGPGATGTNDNCPDDANTNQADGDGDGVGDVCDPCPLDNPDDTDGDGVCDSDDACPGFDDSADADSDGLADGCDICPQDTDNDSDGDTICNTGPTGPGATGTNDNCPDDANTNQADGDGDGVGDVCDPCPEDNPDDTDGDGVCDSDDACPGFDDSADADSDGLADGCDICPQDTDNDSDGDTICNTGPTGPGATGTNDNCPDDANTNQADGDGDGVGDVCDPCPLDNPDDTDGDGVCDSDDACPGFDDSADADSDGLADGCDICPQDTDNDSDGDTICNTGPTGPGATGTNDNCPDDANTNQADGDGDGVGDVCDPCPEDNPDDPDGDGVCTGAGNPGEGTTGNDNCPTVPNPDQTDTDGDGAGDACDLCPLDSPNDPDGDGVCASGPFNPPNTGGNDNCLAVPNPDQADTDGDGAGDACDQVEVDKLTLIGGVPYPGSIVWQFTLEGPGVSTSGSIDTQGNLDFGNVTLMAGQTYTLCENDQPAGWSPQIQLDGLVVQDCSSTANTNGDEDCLYNPDHPQDLGSLCIDFSVDSGEVADFAITNTFPGGDPRTIGFWRNWSTCTRGNQAANAERNGGPEAGWFLLDDVLPQTIGLLEVTDCETGVLVLDKREIIGKNKKKANDAAYALAAQLLAAQNNFHVGAETCDSMLSAIADAQSLLTCIEFNGTGDYLPSGGGLQTYTCISMMGDVDRDAALALAATLDSYNNGQLCP